MPGAVITTLAPTSPSGALPIPRLGARRRAAALLVGLVLLAGCGPDDPLVLGQALDEASAIPLSRLLEGEAVPGSSVVVQGRVGEVCRSSGCWFVLEEASEERAWQLMVDLKPAAEFTIPRSVIGRPVIVAGRLAGEASDLELHATGVVVQP